MTFCSLNNDSIDVFLEARAVYPILSLTRGTENAIIRHPYNRSINVFLIVKIKGVWYKCSVASHPALQFLPSLSHLHEAAAFLMPVPRLV
jgi:hypothetical protein